VTRTVALETEAPMSRMQTDVAALHYHSTLLNSNGLIKPQCVCVCVCVCVCNMCVSVYNLSSVCM
jgi:hypothetical protein